jgi:hypothetical protein
MENMRQNCNSHQPRYWASIDHRQAEKGGEDASVSLDRELAVDERDELIDMIRERRSDGEDFHPSAEFGGGGKVTVRRPARTDTTRRNVRIREVNQDLGIGDIGDDRI